MLEELKIDPEFEKVIPPLTKDEYHPNADPSKIIAE